ncbi:MAG: triose-phosphate isomerase [Brevinema sp.]
MARKSMMAGNWKMHKTIAEGVEFINQIKPSLEVKSDREYLICAPFTMLKSLADAAKGSPLLIGAENLYFEEKGAFTGEIAPAMIKDTGATHVLVGHSERRVIFKETDEWCNKKVKAALKAGLVPVLCVGEVLEERESGKLKDVLSTQVNGGFEGLSKEEASKVIIAYEPVWAIGTGKTATPKDADEAHLIIRNILKNLYDTPFAEEMRVLYGGSVKPDNIDELMKMQNIDGGLVGGASLQPADFERICNYNA